MDIPNCISCQALRKVESSCPDLVTARNSAKTTWFGLSSPKSRIPPIPQIFCPKNSFSRPWFVPAQSQHHLHSLHPFSFLPLQDKGLLVEQSRSTVSPEGEQLRFVPRRTAQICPQVGAIPYCRAWQGSAPGTTALAWGAAPESPWAGFSLAVPRSSIQLSPGRDGDGLGAGGSVFSLAHCLN